MIAVALCITTSLDANTYSEQNVNELLKAVDVSQPIYGNKTFGAPKMNIFKGKDKSVYFAYQARYGGDGDHTANILKLFHFKGDKHFKLLDQNIDSVEFVEDNGILKYIRGKYVATLCNVCDGWEVSSPEDIFFVPVKIDIETLHIETELSKEEKQKIISKFNKQAKQNITEQLSYGRSKYPTYVDTVKRELMKLLKP